MISTSKIKKMMVIKKNCSENGTRAEHIGSNPHSNGDGFSRSGDSLLASKKFKTNRIEGIIIEIKAIKNI